MDHRTYADGHRYLVVHPLDDVPEEKRAIDALGPMRLAGAAKFWLMALRVYLIAMAGLVAYHVIGLAGVG